MKGRVSFAIAVFIIISIVFWQKNSYENKIAFLNENIIAYEAEIQKLLAQKHEQDVQIEKLLSDSQFLADHNNELENALSNMKLSMLKNTLPQYWHNTWANTHKSKGTLTPEQIEEINFLLQPVFTHNDQLQVNPLSCFFTSYYNDVRNINFDEFLRYFPYKEASENLFEYEELKSLENWPFRGVTYENIPVPIHRYKSEVLQDVFMTYAGIRLSELTGAGFDETLYLKSTDSYYNYTSDFGPGIFTSTRGEVENGLIKLYGTSLGDAPAVLTIMKIKDKYVIKSFLKE